MVYVFEELVSPTTSARASQVVCIPLTGGSDGGSSIKREVFGCTTHQIVLKPRKFFFRRRPQFSIHTCSSIIFWDFVTTKVCFSITFWRELDPQRVTFVQSFLQLTFYRKVFYVRISIVVITITVINDAAFFTAFRFVYFTFACNFATIFVETLRQAVVFDTTFVVWVTGVEAIFFCTAFVKLTWVALLNRNRIAQLTFEIARILARILLASLFNFNSDRRRN